MHALRRRLPRFAALVLLVWLFTTGATFAHTCKTTIHVDDEDCCAEMSAPAVAATMRADTMVTPTASIAPLLLPQAAVLQLAWVPVVQAVAPATDPPPRGGASEIPIVFLRLAL